MIVKQCNLCKCLDSMYSEEDTEYCYTCASLINNMRLEAERKVKRALKEQYDDVTTNSASVMRLLKYLYTDHPDEFATQFGTQGQTLLKKALGIN